MSRLVEIYIKLNVFFLFSSCSSSTTSSSSWGIKMAQSAQWLDSGRMIWVSNFDNGTGFFPLKNIQDKHHGAHTVPYYMGAKGSFP
jgi:hypothetical protein